MLGRQRSRDGVVFAEIEPCKNETVDASHFVRAHAARVHFSNRNRNGSMRKRVERNLRVCFARLGIANEVFFGRKFNRHYWRHYKFEFAPSTNYSAALGCFGVAAARFLVAAMSASALACDVSISTAVLALLASISALTFCCNA